MGEFEITLDLDPAERKCKAMGFLEARGFSPSHALRMSTRVFILINPDSSAHEYLTRTFCNLQTLRIRLRKIPNRDDVVSGFPGTPSASSRTLSA